MKCQECGHVGTVYVRQTENGEVLCNDCEWNNFVEFCWTTIPAECILEETDEEIMDNGGELIFPRADLQAEYDLYSLDDLDAAMRQAHARLASTEAMARDGFDFKGRKGPCWYADQVLLICQVRSLRHSAQYMPVNLISFGDKDDN